MSELFTAGQWVVVAGTDMQQSARVYMNNRKGRKQARKDDRNLQKILRRTELWTVPGPQEESEE